MTQSKVIIRDIPYRYLPQYFTTDLSLFRHFQNLFLETYAPHIKDDVIELGCEKAYNNRRFFVNSPSYRCTNIGRDFDEYLDVTDMSTVADNSVAGYVCISVLEHVKDFPSALMEIHRTLKPGGTLLLTIPFMYPIHDEVDYWRFSTTFYRESFLGYEIIRVVHLGGTLSTVANLFQRPKRSLRARYFVYKLLGFAALLLAKYVEQIDSSPIGIGIVAVKKSEVNTQL